MDMFYKNKVKKMLAYLDNRRPNLLWVSSKTKAFVIDLYFSTTVFKEDKRAQDLGIKIYSFKIRQLD